MSEWEDHSDPRRILRIGRLCAEFDSHGVAAVASALVAQMVDTIKHREQPYFDRIFVQINADTGLVLVGFGTDLGFENGHIDAVGLYYSGLADEWPSAEPEAEIPFSERIKRIEGVMINGCLEALRARRGELMGFASSLLVLKVLDPDEPTRTSFEVVV